MAVKSLASLLIAFALSISVVVLLLHDTRDDGSQAGKLVEPKSKANSAYAPIRESMDSQQLRAGGSGSGKGDRWLRDIANRAHQMIETASVEKQIDVQMASSRAVNTSTLETGKSGTQMKPKLHAVTYASHGGRDDRFCRAVESSIRSDFDLVILGWGEPWKGLSQKLEAAHRYASSIPGEDVIMFTDAFDVMFMGSPDSVVQKFLHANTPILFSAECGCWPHVMDDKNICLHRYPPSPTPYRYLNSGTWIGHAHAAAAMLADVIKEAGNNFARANDQKLVADMYMAGRHGIKLDFYNDIFQSMHMTLDKPLPHCDPSEDVRMRNTRFHNIRTRTEPEVFHFNGGGKRHHLKMEGQMWYKARQHNTPEAREALREHLLTMPGKTDAERQFKSICGGYLN